jgi:lipid-binding SYLF domain-containing protein
MVKAGFFWSGRGGTGLVVSRLDDGSWSAPSAICAAGIGIGAQIGCQITDVVFVLNTKQAVKAFTKPNITLGGNISVATGPTGRSSEASGCNIL